MSTSLADVRKLTVFAVFILFIYSDDTEKMCNKNNKHGTV